MSSDRELLLDLLGDAYKILLAYGVERSSNMDRVLLMDAIKLELEFGDRATVQPNGVTGCICKGNWCAIVKEMEPWLDKKFTDQHGQEWTFYGIVHGSDDYYYGVARAGETHLLSCVGALESYGYEPVATDPTDAAP